jgi:hypothetical protein
MACCFLLLLWRQTRYPKPAKAMSPTGTPTPAPMAAPFVLPPPLEAELEVDAAAFVVVAAVVLALIAELEVFEVDEETWLRGIWASTVGAGEILKMSGGVLQHAKLPSPVVPLSQQLRALKLSSSGNPTLGLTILWFL